MHRLGLVLLGVMGLAFVGYRFVLPRLWSRPAPSAVVLEGEPRQAPLEPPQRLTVTRGERQYVVEKLFDYEISGEVLSASTYDVTWTNDFADVDLGLLWGPKRAQLKERFKFFQMGRWLFWRSETQVSEEERGEVGRHISNNHLIPSEGSKHLARAFRMLRKGDEVRLKGALVRISGPDGPVADSSTVRDDTGDGACEVVWVDELQVGGRIFH
jgi:hypothetical protein